MTGFIQQLKTCAGCRMEALCRFTGRRWLCRRCFNDYVDGGRA